MLGPRYVLTPYQKKLFDMDYQKHVKRLESIKNPAKKQLVDEKEMQWRKTMTEVRIKNLQFQSNEKIISIDKDNQVLLDKLVKISRNKKPPLINSNAKTWDLHPGTLNTFYRKRELERIATENESFARRLISQQGAFNRKQLDTDFEKHLGLVKLVQKVTSPTMSNKDKQLSSPMTSPNGKRKKKGFKIKKGKKDKPRKETQETLHTEATQNNVESETYSGKMHKDNNNLDTLLREAHSNQKLSLEISTKNVDEKQGENNKDKEENRENINEESPLDSKRLKTEDNKEDPKEGSSGKISNRSRRSGTVEHKNLAGLAGGILSGRRGSGSGNLIGGNEKEKSLGKDTERGGVTVKTIEDEKKIEGKEGTWNETNQKKEGSSQIEKI